MGAYFIVTLFLGILWDNKINNIKIKSENNKNNEDIKNTANINNKYNIKLIIFSKNYSRLSNIITLGTKTSIIKKDIFSLNIKYYSITKL